MKILIIFLFILCGIQSAKASDTGDPNVIVEQMISEIILVQQKYTNRYNVIYKKLAFINVQLNENIGSDKKLNILIERTVLLDEESKLNYEEKGEISKIRYLKGLEIIRLLYDKILALDHHFSTVATFRDINNITNPNFYPEFIKMKDDVNSNQDKRTGFNLTDVLGNNIYTSVVYTFVSLFTSEKTNKNEKESQIAEVECILDFSLRMNNDLKAIYFDTSFLQRRNKNMLSDILQLFTDFTKPLGYSIGLEECRNSDDWESIRQQLNTYLKELNKTVDDQANPNKTRKMLINLEFPIDRLLQFIIQYNDYINQGTNFYQKFEIMLSSYESEKQCVTKTPIEFTRLKDGVRIAIEKFNTAYKPVEINGTKMKEILYGINEYN